MITEEEKQEIIDKTIIKVQEIIDKAIGKAKEELLLLLPTTMANLMTQHAVLNKLNGEFYSKHKEFQEHKDVVVSAIEKIEGNNPGMDYEKILKEAVPEIRSRINTLNNLNMNNVPSKPDRTFNDSNNGMI